MARAANFVSFRLGSKDILDQSGFGFGFEGPWAENVTRDRHAMRNRVIGLEQSAVRRHKFDSAFRPIGQLP